MALVAAPTAWAAPAAPDSEVAAAIASLRPAVRAALVAKGTVPLATMPRYLLNLALSSDLTLFSLTEEVTYTNNEGVPLRDMAFRIFANRTLEPPPVTVNDVGCEPTACRVVRDSSSTIRVIPEAPLAPGASLRIRLVSTGRLRVLAPGETDMASQSLKGMSSLFSAPTRATDYGLLAQGDGITSLASFYPVLASRRSGRWVTAEKTTTGDLTTDETALVQAWVVVPSGVSIAATGTEQLQSTKNGKNTYLVSAGPTRDFALLASRKLVTVTRGLGDVTVRSSFVQGDDASGMKVLDTATEALRVFEARFGAYPYRELDLVEAPVVGGAGGMEFSGLATVASMFYRANGGGLEALLSLLGGGAGRDFRLSALEFTTAHEVAHQYWHGLVGSDSREHAFADEALAQWSTLLYLEDRYGTERARADAEQHVLMNYRMMRLLGQPDGSVDRPVDSFPSTIAYAGLVYGKGAYLYPELRRAVGDREFFAGLRRYVARYQFQLAPRDGLFIELCGSARAAREVQRLTQRYLRESHGDEDLGIEANASDPLATLLGQLGEGAVLADLLGQPGSPRAAGESRGSRGRQRSGANLFGIDEKELDRLMKSLEDAGNLASGSQGLLDSLLEALPSPDTEAQDSDGKTPRPEKLGTDKPGTQRQGKKK